MSAGYEQLEIEAELLSGGMVTVASRTNAHRNETAIRIANRHAALHAALEG
jgi:hypothetical protein